MFRVKISLQILFPLVILSKVQLAETYVFVWSNLSVGRISPLYMCWLEKFCSTLFSSLKYANLMTVLEYKILVCLHGEYRIKI